MTNIKRTTLRFLPAIVSVATGTLLFGPATLLHRLGLAPFVAGYRAAIGLTCLIAAAVVVVAQFVPWVFGVLRRQLAEWWRKRKATRRLHELTRSEKNLLKQYVTRETRTLVLDASSSATSSLMLAGLIYRAVELDDKALGLAFNVEEWALAYLKKNRHLLETSEVSSARLRPTAPSGQSVTTPGSANGRLG